MLSFLKIWVVFDFFFDFLETTAEEIRSKEQVVKIFPTQAIYPNFDKESSVDLENLTN